MDGVKTTAAANGRTYFAGISVAPDSRPKNSNPKESIGSSKIPMHLWPHTATVMGALGLQDGALKYGRGNYRASPVRASIYYDAAIRHLFGWFSGRPCDPDSGLPDLAHALACLAIVVDADAAGTLIDARDYNSGYPKFIAEMTQHVKRLQEMHKDKMPRHYTISGAV
ncbi:Uncharacterised protein [Burkholderia pseudomallei]|uniref:dATP/dGTP diphosphohydrolase domain-containing protein n=1 Tax=Burkholderia pseudomallei TaxID=28450 RepID=UPI000F1248C6|nr:dATP/dGTP diphosphohydrolase domain-containing protein [Burkholderia pseudomallei]CAJ9766630.1 Uncharacterised protein [Burkholderia pseudomallei]VBS00545.1 Uncharacterised protein [Burkholderia pseudomallei]